MKIKLVHQENGFKIYKDENYFMIINPIGYILKSSKTIYPCLKFIREEKKFEIIEFNFPWSFACGKHYFKDGSALSFTVKKVLNYKLK